MAVIFSDLKKSIIELLSDTVVLADVYEELHGTQTSAKILEDGVKAALAAAAHKIWKPATLEIAEGVSTVTLPDDFIDVEGIRDNTTGKLLSSLPLKVNSDYESGWINFPYGYLAFSAALADGGLMYYSAMWSVPVEDGYGNKDSYEMDMPLFLVPAVTYYAAAYAFFQRATQSAVIRQYNTKIDSGTPIDNPLLEMSKTFMMMYETELKRLPTMTKGVTF